MHRVRSLLVLALASSMTAVGIVAVSPASAQGAPEPGAAPDCSAFTDPVYRVVKTKNDASLVTPWLGEATDAASYGFNDNQGEAFAASLAPAPGLVEVHRLYRSIGQDFLVTADEDDWAAAADSVVTGYDDQGLTFYASPVAADCLSPVLRYTKDGKNRLAATETDSAGLEADGWTSQGPAFYAALPDGSTPPSDPTPTPTPTPADTPTTEPTDDPTTPGGQPTDDPSDTVFSFADMPDTQQEVLSAKDKRFANRTQWLVDNRKNLDLRFVTHTGDVHNWDTPAHDQYEVSSKAMAILEKANIPYTLSIGNHDTEATGVGGGARDTKKTRILQRDTTTFNSYYDAARFGAVAGAYEKGKVDNVYALYEAGGLKWLVLSLELWPRQGAVDWAESVIKSHPDYNVIVTTHDYVDGNGIGDASEYGDTSPQHLYDTVLSKYDNVKIVLSGHVGIASSRIDTTPGGNKIYDFLTTFHSNTTNPTRLFTIDTANGTLKTWIYAPFNDQTFTQYSQTITGIKWVK